MLKKKSALLFIKNKKKIKDIFQNFKRFKMIRGFLLIKALNQNHE